MLSCLSRGYGSLASDFLWIEWRMITKHCPCPDQNLARPGNQPRLFRLAASDQPQVKPPQDVLTPPPAQSAQEQAPAHASIALPRDAGAFVHTAATLIGLRVQPGIGYQSFGISQSVGQRLPACQQD